MSYFMALTWPTMKGQAVTWHLWSDKCRYGVSRGSTWDKKILRLVKTTAKQGLCQASGSMDAASCSSPPALAAWMNAHSKPGPWSPFGENSKEESPSHYAACSMVTSTHDALYHMGMAGKVRRKWEFVNSESFYPPSLKFSITFKWANCSLCFRHKHSIWNVKQLSVFIPVLPI